MRIIGNDPSTPRQAQIVASGTLPSGQPVVVNADGTVSVIASSSVPQSIGTAATVNTGTSGDISAIYDSANNKVVVFYRDESNSNYGTASVGTINGTSLSFGSEVVFASEYVGYVNSVYDVAAGKAVVFYSNASAHGRCNVGTVSGASISFGSQVTVTTNTTYTQTSAYDTVNQKIVLAMQRASGGGCLVGTVSGTSVSFGSEAVFETSNVSLYVGGMAYNAATGKFVLAYRERTNNYGQCKVATVSGTSISVGSVEGFNSSNTQQIVVSSDLTSSHVVIYYKDTSGSQKGEARVGTITGTSIAVGSLTQYSAGEVNRQSAIYNVAAGKHVVFFPDQSDSTKGFFCEGTVSGTSVSFTSPVQYEAGTTIWATGAAYISDEKVVVNAFADNSDSGKGKAIVIRNAYSSNNLTSENYIGMSGGAVFQTGSAASVGTAVNFNSGNTDNTAATFDSNSNKVVIAYRDIDSSQYGTAVVGTVDPSDNSISFGSEVVFESAVTSAIGMTFDSNSNKVVIVYKDEGNSSYGTAIVGTVSGTSISFGTPVVYSSATTSSNSATFDSNSNKVVVGYTSGAKVGTISGTSISFGSQTAFIGSSASRTSMVFDSNSNKVVISSRAQSDDKSYVAVGTVSGTSISFGTAVQIGTGVNNSCISSVFDSNSNKVVIAFGDGSSSGQGTAVVGTVSGTSISFGSEVVFDTSAVRLNQNFSFDTESNKVVVAYKDNDNSNYLTFIDGTVSGTSISFGSPVVFAVAIGAGDEIGTVFDS